MPAYRRLLCSARRANCGSGVTIRVLLQTGNILQMEPNGAFKVNTSPSRSRGGAGPMDISGPDVVFPKPSDQSQLRASTAAAAIAAAAAAPLAAASDPGLVNGEAAVGGANGLLWAVTAPAGVGGVQPMGPVNSPQPPAAAVHGGLLGTPDPAAAVETALAMDQGGLPLGGSIQDVPMQQQQHGVQQQQQPLERRLPTPQELDQMLAGAVGLKCNED